MSLVFTLRWLGMNEYCLNTSLLSKHHSLTVEEMAIFPTSTKPGTEPSNPRWTAFPGNESSSRKSFANAGGQ